MENKAKKVSKYFCYYIISAAEVILPATNWGDSNERGLYKDLEGNGCSVLNYQSGILLCRLKKTAKKHSQDRQQVGRDSNPGLCRT
jgi:hypothetical protein